MITNNPTTSALLLAATLAAPTTGKTPTTTPISAAELAAWEAPNPYANPLAGEFSAMNLGIRDEGGLRSNYPTRNEIDLILQKIADTTLNGMLTPHVIGPIKTETK